MWFDGFAIDMQVLLLIEFACLFFAWKKVIFKEFRRRIEKFDLCFQEKSRCSTWF